MVKKVKLTPDVGLKEMAQASLDQYRTPHPNRREHLERVAAEIFRAGRTEVMVSCLLPPDVTITGVMGVTKDGRAIPLEMLGISQTVMTVPVKAKP